MLIQYLDDHPDAQVAGRGPRTTATCGTVSALDGLYKLARAQFDTDAGFADRARRRVVTLQAGDEATLAVLARAGGPSRRRRSR